VNNVNYLEQAKSFLSQNSHRLALRVGPLALMAVAAAHASNSTLSFNALTSGTVSDSCSGGSSVVTALAGGPTNGGLGLTLSGKASLPGPAASSVPCSLTMSWNGNGSGLFPGTSATLGSTFTVAAPYDVAINSCTVTVYLNGVQAGQFSPSCASAASPLFVGGFAPRIPNRPIPVSLTGQVFSVPSSLTSWQVNLVVTGTWIDSNPYPFSVTVPSASSIDILAQVSAVPALSPLAFGMTAILLLSLAGFGILRRRSTGSGFPGRPS
jgi:hypothetical protein